MNNLEIMGQIALPVSFVIATCLRVMYMFFWKKFIAAFEKENKRPFGHSQQELHEASKNDIVGAYKMCADNMFKASYVIFKMKTDNPALLRPLKGIRRTLLAFVLFPFVLGAILVALTIIMTS